MSEDTEPLLFTVSLGALRPANGAAEDALRALGNNASVRVEIKRASGNVLRLRWYWQMLRLFLDNMRDAFDGPMTPKMLHRWLKREAGLATPVVAKKTGEIIDWDYGSISFAKMDEAERAEFVDFAAKKLSARLGVDIETLKREAQAA